MIEHCYIRLDLIKSIFMIVITIYQHLIEVIIYTMIMRLTADLGKINRNEINRFTQ